MEKTAELAELVAKAGALHRVLEDARSKRDTAEAIINATINDYVGTKNKIAALIDATIYAAADVPPSNAEEAPG